MLRAYIWFLRHYDHLLRVQSGVRDNSPLLENNSHSHRIRRQSNRARGGCIVPAPIQLACSYTVYAGAQLMYVVQFRLESLAVKTELSSLATEIYGSFAPTIPFEGMIGDQEDNPLYVYLMSRVKGLTHLEIILIKEFTENSPNNMRWRQNLVGDMARSVLSSVPQAYL